MIFRKQVKKIKGLYSCGYGGADPARRVLSQQPAGDPDLHPDFYPEPCRLIEGVMQGGDSGLPGGKGRVPAAGDSPGSIASRGPPEVPWWLIEAVPGPRLSDKFGAEEKLGFLADRFR